MIITVTLNPALDRTIVAPNFAVDRVCRAASSRLDPGGKGVNVSRAVNRLGGRTAALGVAGGAAGEYIRDQLDLLGIRNDFVFVREETRTNLKIVDPERHTNTDLNLPGAPVGVEALQELWQKLCDLAEPGDTVVFAGKNPPDLPDQQLADWIGQLKPQGIRTALDTVGMAMKIGVAAGPTVIKPNALELAELCETELPTRKALADAARRVVDNGVAHVVVSLGADGALFADESGVLHAHGVRVPVGSTVGAGDAMLASVLLDLERGEPKEAMAARAVAVSAACVARPGTEPAGWEEIEPLIPQVHIEQL